MAPIIIRAKKLFDGKGQREDACVVVEKDKIIDIVGNKKIQPDFEGFVTPAFIDAHSHIGMCREGEPSQEAEHSDKLAQISPCNDPMNSIYFDDRAFANAIDFGVLYGCVVPGSGNVIGGKAKVIKYYATNRAEALISDYGYKMALGYNPRSTTEWKGERPNTRMGVYALLEKKFNEVILKKDKADLEREESKKKKRGKEDSVIERKYKMNFSDEDLLILEILSGKKTAKVHVHKDDDVYYLIELVKKYGIKATAEHVCDVFRTETFNALAENNIDVVYGPLGSFAYKVELKNENYRNVRFLMKSKSFYGLMTDHPIIQTSSLRDSLKFFMIQGMSEEEAISLITYKNANEEKETISFENNTATTSPEGLF